MGNSKIPAGGGCYPGPHGSSSTVYTPPIYRVDYDTLSDKPSINGIVLEGNKTTEDLGIHVDPGDLPIASDEDIDNLFPANW